jgi:hypothetical protein
MFLHHIPPLIKECTNIYLGAGLELKEGDKGWLGAWWLGFVIVAALTAFISPFLGNFVSKQRGRL